MVKNIIVFYYLPSSIFILYCCCSIINIIVYVITKNRIIIPIFVFCLALTFISLIYIYPINMYIYIPHYVFAFIIVFIGMYYLLFAITPFTITINTLWNTFFQIIAKSIIILFFTTILSNNIHDHQKIIISNVDMILSLGILFVKLENTTYSRMLVPHRAPLQLMVLITIGYCLVVMDSFVVLPSLFVFAVLSICTISLIAQFLISICNGAHHDYIKIDNERLYTSDKYNTLIKIIKEQVNAYYNSPIDRYTIAMQCEMHPDYISKIFKSEEGITINKYIQIVRLEKAHHLLLYSNKKIIEVAFDVGYENLATFYRHFVKHYKKSPRQIRKEKCNG